MESQVRKPHPTGCFLAKVEDIYGPSKVRQLQILGVCGVTCRDTKPTAVMMAVLLQLAPRPNGWARWNAKCTPPESYGSLQGRAKDYTDTLRNLISISPRPRSYKRWIALLDLIGEEIGGTGRCVRCHKVTPLADMVHRESGQEISEIAGLVCTACVDEIKKKGR